MNILSTSILPNEPVPLLVELSAEPVAVILLNNAADALTRLAETIPVAWILPLALINPDVTISLEEYK